MGCQFACLESRVKANVLLMGLDGAGKTQLLYKLRLKRSNAAFQPTNAFNYEIVRQAYMGRKFILQMWDLAGRAELRSICRYFYNNMKTDFVFYIVSARDRSRLTTARNHLELLRHETPMENSKFIIVLNSFASRDTERFFEITVEDIQEIFGDGLPIIKVNAKTGEGLKGFFRCISEVSS